MNANEILRIVDSLHRDKNIDKDIVFRAIESAIVTAARKYFGEEVEIECVIDRTSGQISGRCGDRPLDYEEVVGRIGAQTAKQVIIQKVREAERDALIREFSELLDEIVTGTINRNEGRVTTVTLGTVEAILPRSEQIPGEKHEPNERIRAMVTEVKPHGNRIKVVLSRTRPKMVQRLFEQEIPEIAEGVIVIKTVAREPGHRSKIAVTSIDSHVDSVGACVGVRGNRIKSIIDELNGERIDIVPYDEDPQVMIRNSLKPAEVEEVILCRMLGRAIVLVVEDQLSLAIGKWGQNVRLASKLSGWDIEIMTQAELERQIEKAVMGFSAIEGVTEELANQLVGEGYLSYDDLSVIEPSDLQAMGQLTEEQVDQIVEQAELLAEQAEQLKETQQSVRPVRQQEAPRSADSGERAGSPTESSAAAEDGQPAPQTNGEAESHTSATAADEGDERSLVDEPG